MGAGLVQGNAVFGNGHFEAHVKCLRRNSVAVASRCPHGNNSGVIAGGKAALRHNGKRV